jgi:hypothetical protein
VRGAPVVRNFSFTCTIVPHCFELRATASYTSYVGPTGPIATFLPLNFFSTALDILVLSLNAWTLMCPPLFQQHPYLQMDILMSFPLLNIAPNNRPFCQCHLLNVAPSDSPRCQWTFHPNLPMDISVSSPLLNVAPSDSLICPWTSQCPFLF